MNEPIYLTHDETSDHGLRWQDVLAAIGRRRLLFLTVFLGGAIASAFIAWSTPPEYRAVASLIVRSNVAQITISPDDEHSARVPGETPYESKEDDINSAVAALQRPVLVRRVLAENAGSVPPADGAAGGAALKAAAAKVFSFPAEAYRRAHGVSTGTELDRQVQEALEALSVKPIERSNLIEVSFRHRDPVWATHFVNGLVDAHLRRRDQIREPKDAVRFFNEQRALAAERFQSAKAASRAFRESEGTNLEFENVEDLRAMRVALLEARSKTESELAGVDARVDALEGEVNVLPATDLFDQQVEESPTVQVLKARLMELEVERGELLTTYTPGSVMMEQHTRLIAKIEAMLNEERVHTRKALRTSGPASRKLQLDLIEARTERSQLTARLGALTTQIDHLTVKLDRLDGLAARWHELETQLGMAKSTYLTYLKKEEEVRFAGALQESSIANLALENEAVAPTMPEPSPAPLMMAVGSSMSLFLAIVLVMMRERMDPVVNGAPDAELVTSLPVLAALEYESESDAAGDEVEEGSARSERQPPGLRLVRKPGVYAGALLVLIGAVLTMSVGTDGRRASKTDGVPAPTRSSAFASTEPAATTSTATLADASRERWSAADARLEAGLVIEATRQRAARRTAETPDLAVAAAVYEAAPAQPAVAVEAAEPELDAVPAPAGDDSAPAAEWEIYVSPVESSGGSDSTAVDAAAPKAGDAQTVVVGRGATLYSLAMSIYGRYDDAVLALLQEANTQLFESTTIFEDETLRFPALPSGGGEAVAAVVHGADLDAVDVVVNAEDIEPSVSLAVEAEFETSAGGERFDVVHAAETVRPVHAIDRLAALVAGDRVQPSPASAAAAVAGSPAESSTLQPRHDDYDKIVVADGVTLYSLAAHYYGAYTPQVLELLRAANPRLGDPTQIRAGEVLLFPRVAAAELVSSD